MWILSASLSLSFVWAFGSWAYAAHRRPVPAHWTRSAGASSAVVLAVILLCAFGIGSVLATTLSPLAALSELNMQTATAAVAAPALAVLATGVLHRRSDHAA